MTTQPIYKQYDFDNWFDFFYYIVDSKINGQPQQVRKLLSEMAPADIAAFIKFNTDSGDTSEPVIYCKGVAVEVLAEKATAPDPNKQPTGEWIKTVDVEAKEWFDKSAGNSYFSVQVTINFGLPDQKTIYVPYGYGYGSQYEYAAFWALQDAEIIPQQTRPGAPWRYYQDHNIIARHTKQEKCKKADVKAWGTNG